MLKTFIALLGSDAGVFRRFVAMAAGYGVLCGLTITSVVPVVGHLLDDDVRRTVPWLAALTAGLIACWLVRRHVEQAGVRVGVAILQHGRHRLGEHVARLPVGWFTPQNTAQLAHLITRGTMSIAQLPAHVFTPVIAGIVAPFVFVLALLVLHRPMGVVALIALPLLAGVLHLSGRLSRRADDEYQQQFAEASQRVVEFAQAQSVLRAFNGHGSSTRWLEHGVTGQHRLAARLIRLSAGSAVLNLWAVQAASAALLVTAAVTLTDRPDTPGAAGHAVGTIAALLLASRFIDSLLEVVGYGEAVRSARGPLEAVARLFAQQPLPQTGAPQTPRDASVELRDVHFRYAAEQPEVLRGIDLHVAPGTMTALIGASGSGKTTLLRLVARFFDVDRGSVLIGGIDVRQIGSAELTGMLGQIFQDSRLFTGTIADNIRIGRPDATDAELLQAVQQAGVAELVERLPHGLQTPVGEGGSRLSGGERQRIAIARALIRNARILLVDEATAALDAENQAAITRTLMQMRGRCTLIVIAHQLSTVAMADRIVVLHDGRIVEHGTPAGLRGQDGHYARWLREQDTASGWRIAAGPADDAAS